MSELFHNTRDIHIGNTTSHQNITCNVQKAGKSD